MKSIVASISSLNTLFVSSQYLSFYVKTKNDGMYSKAVDL